MDIYNLKSLSYDELSNQLLELQRKRAIATRCCSMTVVNQLDHYIQLMSFELQERHAVDQFKKVTTENTFMSDQDKIAEIEEKKKAAAPTKTLRPIVKTSAPTVTSNTK